MDSESSESYTGLAPMVVRGWGWVAVPGRSEDLCDSNFLGPKEGAPRLFHRLSREAEGGLGLDICLHT